MLIFSNTRGERSFLGLITAISLATDKCLNPQSMSAFDNSVSKPLFQTFLVRA